MNVKQQLCSYETVSATDLSYDIITHPDKLSSLQAEWDSLYNKADKPSFSQSFAWNLCCWQTVSMKKEQLCCLIIRHQNLAVLILPLAVNKKYGLFSVAHCLGAISTEYSNVLIDARWNAEVLLNLALTQLSQHHCCDAIEFTNTRADSALYQVLNALPNKTIAGIGVAPYITLANYKDWTDYAYSVLSKSMRNNLSRRSKKLSQLGAVSFEIVGGDKPYEQVLDWLIKTKSVWASNKHLNWTPLLNEDYIACIRDIIGQADSEQGQMRLCVLKLDDKPIAAQLMSINQTHVEYINHAHDLEYVKESPGQIMLQYCMQWAFEQKMMVVDFRIGDTSDKRDWVSEICDIASYDLYCNSKGSLYIVVKNALNQARIIKNKLLAAK